MERLFHCISKLKNLKKLQGAKQYQYFFKLNAVNIYPTRFNNTPNQKKMLYYD